MPPKKLGCRHGHQLWSGDKKKTVSQNSSKHFVCCWSLYCVQIIKMYDCNKCKKTTSLKTSYVYRTKTMPKKPQIYKKYDKQFDSRAKINYHKNTYKQLKHVKDKQKGNYSSFDRLAYPKLNSTNKLENNKIDKMEPDKAIERVFNETSNIKQYEITSQTTPNIYFSKHKSQASSSSFILKQKRICTQAMELKSLDQTKQIPDKIKWLQIKQHQRPEEDLTPNKKAKDLIFSKKSFNSSPNVGISAYSLKKDHLCTECGKVFKFPNRLQRHMKVHTGAKPFKCNMCGKGFSSNQSLKNHKKFVEVSNLRCDICGMQFCTNFTFTTHKISHTFPLETEQRNEYEGQMFKCSLCEKVFDSAAALSSHTSVHQNKQSNNCEMIGAASANQGGHDEHLKSHKSKMINTGSLDSKQAHLFLDSKCPQKQHKVYHCGMCAKTFHQEPYYRVHMLSHTKRSSPLAKGGQLQSDKMFFCDICPESFHTKAYMMAHKISHTDKSLTCTICHKPYRYFSRLSEHMLFHTREKPYQCSVCQKYYPYYGSLQSHMLIHTDLKPFKCEVCHQSFIKKCELVKHLSVHTGEKRHMCEECGKCFRTWSSLRTHDKTHSGEKPHKCHHCSKGFVTRGHLKTHMRIHTGEKPYCCEICGKQCAIKGNLRKHLSTHRKNNADRKVAEMEQVNTDFVPSIIGHELYHGHSLPHELPNPCVFDAYQQTYLQPDGNFQHDGMYKNI